MNSPFIPRELKRDDGKTAIVLPAAREFRTIIVDDEPLARERLKKLISAHRDFTVVGECGNGRQLMDTVRAFTPDLVLLDIQMPEMDGLTAWRQLAGGSLRLPLVIFVTAHMEFAIHGFDVRALDYLLKPVSGERFAAALERVRAALALPSDGALPVMRRDRDFSASSEPKYLEMIVLKQGGEFHFVKVDEIVWVGAEGDFIKVHTATGGYLVRQSLASIVAALDPQHFIRIHRSHLVARTRIRKISVLQRSDYVVVLADGTELRVSRPYSGAIKGLVAAHKA